MYIVDILMCNDDSHVCTYPLEYEMERFHIEDLSIPQCSKTKSCRDSMCNCLGSYTKENEKQH